MSSTRHAPEGAPISYERYMSSPEYTKLRGIPGTAVAAKAQLYNDARKRSLLYFLQSLSLKDGGLRRVAQAIADDVPDSTEEELARFMVELCIDPKINLRFPKKVHAAKSDGVIDALRLFQDRYEARIKSDFVLTTIGREIFETLDHALAIGKMVVIEGESGSGKTTAAQAWCAQHQGQVRFVSLNGIIHKTGFFRELATLVGLAASNRKAIKMQIKVEEFFRKTGLMLVIDEAHYLFRHQQRSNSSPELVDWVNTALVNRNVPVALICTDQFAKLKNRVEKQTGWTSEQLEHRVKRYKKLPTTPIKRDLEAVATKLLTMRWNTIEEKWNGVGPAPHRDFVNLVVGYALTCRMRLPAVANTVEEARYQARKHNRSQILATDIRAALLDYQIPSDEALQQAFQSTEKRREPAIQIVSAPFASALQRSCARVA
jgi:AAA domain